MPADLINPEAFERYLQTTLLQQVYERLLSGKLRLINKVGSLVRQSLVESPEYTSILSGRLRTSFGIEDQKTALTEITEAVVSSIFVEVILLGESVDCTVNVLKDDFSEVLTLENASYTYQGRAKTLPSGRRLLGGKIEIPWLEWLLFRGDSIIILDAQVANVGPTSSSRTGVHVMIHPKSPRGFGVPPEYSGVKEDNWFIRTLLPLQDEVIDEIWNIVNG